MHEVKRNILIVLCQKNDLLFQSLSVSCLEKYISTFTGHVCNDKISFVDLIVYPFKDASIINLFINSLAIHIQFFASLLNSKFVNIIEGLFKGH